MAWEIRRPGSEVSVEFTNEGEPLFTAVYTTPTRAEAEEHGRTIANAPDDTPIYLSIAPKILGARLKRIEGATVDGEPFELERDGNGSISEDSLNLLLPYVPTLVKRAIAMWSARTDDDVKNS